MSDNKFHFKNDECYIQQQNKDNKSIFNYIVDNNMFVNQNSCFDTTPPFLNYIPIGIPTQNVDIENELRGATRNNTRCTSCKYQGDTSVDGKKDVNFTQHECKPEFKILPHGYFNN